MVFTLPATIAIPLLPFPFQPFASRCFLVLLFFFFLLVPKSLLCCSGCFAPVLVYVQSSSICPASLLSHRFHICSFSVAALQYWHGPATGSVGFFVDTCYQTHPLLSHPPRSLSMFHTRTTELAVPVFYTVLFFLGWFLSARSSSI